MFFSLLRLCYTDEYWTIKPSRIVGDYNWAGIFPQSKMSRLWKTGRNIFRLPFTGLARSLPVSPHIVRFHLWCRVNVELAFSSCSMLEMHLTNSEEVIILRSDLLNSILITYINGTTVFRANEWNYKIRGNYTKEVLTQTGKIPTDRVLLLTKWP